MNILLDANEFRSFCQIMSRGRKSEKTLDGIYAKEKSNSI